MTTSNCKFIKSLRADIVKTSEKKTTNHYHLHFGSHYAVDFMPFSFVQNDEAIFFHRNILYLSLGHHSDMIVALIVLAQNDINIRIGRVWHSFYHGFSDHP